MNALIKLLCLSLLWAGFAFSKNVDVYFAKCSGGLCVSTSDMTSKRETADGKSSKGPQVASVRALIVDPVEDAASRYKVRLERPFFILDGIYLSTDEVRSLDDFYKETEQFGIPEMLSNLGYTPVLIQFSETVQQSIVDNSKLFRDVLQFFNSNVHVGFPNAHNDGFVVMGISQGGIIGRYGAYLYDQKRKKTDAPIRFYASLDSPHQGAVMPKGLLETLKFWAKEGGSSDAEAFNDIIAAPGASDLLLRQDSSNNEANTDSSRFLFGEYRKACEYNGFPAVLVAQGQMKGKSPKHDSVMFALRRVAERNGSAYGRVISRMYSSDKASSRVSRNYMYKFMDGTVEKDANGDSRLDFIQGSTYPFAKTIYKALKQGFQNEMPNSFSSNILGPISLSFKSKWLEDTLVTPNSTFIPTASAMDLNCSGDLAIRNKCSYTVSSKGFPFDSPGKRSSAYRVYAVDESHPRYASEMSGRHIELPNHSDGSVDSLVLRGMQVDIWRVVCELAKVDYDSVAGVFRNPYFAGVVSPKANCMDLSKMPGVVRNSGEMQKEKFPYARYSYNAKASEADDVVSFDLPAGWQKVAVFDYGKEIPANAIFEMKVKVDSPKSNWMKAELLLQRAKIGSGVQLNEVSVQQDGQYQIVRWQMPSTSGVLANYRWFCVVLNSAGAKVKISSPRLVKNLVDARAVPDAISSAMILPSNYNIVPWSSDVRIKDYSDKMGNGVSLEFDKVFDGAFVDFGKSVSFDQFSKIEVSYWPGTCQKTRAYFDSKIIRNANLAGGVEKNGFVVKSLPLADVVNVDFTPNSGYSAAKLNLQGTVAGEQCIIKSIILK